MQNRILKFRIRSTGSFTVASFTTINRAVGEVISASITKLLNSAGASARTRSAGTAFLIEVRGS